MRAKPSRENSGLRFLQTGVSLLFVLLILEGLIRKMIPSLSIPLFFAKYLLTFAVGVKAVSGTISGAARKILALQAAAVLIVLPCFLNTALKDQLLAVFGMTQYCLFPFAGVAVCAAFPPGQWRNFLKFLRLLVMSLLITSGIALIQNHLPSNHWLNQSIDGTDLNAFSAGGRLRVSSTFAFVAQYCIYLNATAAALVSYLALSNRHRKPSFWVLAITLVLALIVGLFITGSRSAVYGSFAVIVFGLSAALFTRGRRMVGLVLALIMIAPAGYVLTHALLPESYSAFEARVQGGASDHSPEKMAERVGMALFGWSSWYKVVPFLGNGIGIESNGSEKFSRYAKAEKTEWGWMESDQSAVLFEGGIYLMVLWYAFRFFIIVYTGISILGIRDPGMAFAAAMSWGFVAPIGIMANLSSQAPAAIWWWLNVGLVFAYREFSASYSRPREATPLPWKNR